MSGDDLSTVPDYPAEIHPNWASWWTSRGRPASFRAVDRPDYGSLVNRQVVAAGERLGPGDLGDLLSSGTTWQT